MNKTLKTLHIVPGLNDPTNGIAVAAKMIACRQNADIVDVRDLQSSSRIIQGIERYSEVWVHSMWLPKTLLACWRVLRAGVPLVRMPHGCMDPVKVRYHLWKKIWFLPIEWWLFHRTKRIVSTEDDEDLWIAGWHTGTEIERVDLFGDVKYNPRLGLGNRKFLFVGRMHPLKGVDVLIEAIRSLKAGGRLPDDFQLTIIGKDEKEMRAGFESAAKGLPVRFLGEVEEDVKRREMSVADCLVLPTLSENFGLVVKESLECGVPAITTDGAKYWKGKPGVMYIEGFLAADYAKRVDMVSRAIFRVVKREGCLMEKAQTAEGSKYATISQIKELQVELIGEE